MSARGDYRDAAYWNAGVTCAFVFALAGCNPEPKHGLRRNVPTPSPTASQGTPPLKITGHGGPTKPLRIIEQRGNRRQYVLVGRAWESRTAQGLAHVTFYDATVTFYALSGKRLTAQAPRAIADQGSKTVTLLGGVRGHSSDGVILSCETLTYHRDDDLLHGEGNVRISNRAGNVLTGSRFDSDVSLAKIRMQ